LNDYSWIPPPKPNRTLRRAWTVFLVLILIGTAFMLNGCATPEQDARTLLDRVEFEGDEYGSFEVEGNMDLGGIPFFGAQVHIKLEKIKDKPATLLP
jgi:hypothetical protein